jgi:hypothetical protein
VRQPYGWTNELPPDHIDIDRVWSAAKAATDALYGRNYRQGPTFTTIYPASGLGLDYNYEGNGVPFSIATEMRSSNGNGPADPVCHRRPPPGRGCILCWLMHGPGPTGPAWQRRALGGDEGGGLGGTQRVYPRPLGHKDQVRPWHGPRPAWCMLGSARLSSAHHARGGGRPHWHRHPKPAADGN